MNRKIMLIPLSLAAAFSLVACNGGNQGSSTPSSEPSSSSSSSQAVVDVTVDQTSVSVEVNKFVSVTATVTGTTNKNVTWSSADETIATVEAGVITGKKIGTTTVTVTSDADNTKKATITVEVTAETIDSTKTTVAELVDGTDIKEKTVYEVEGILEGLSHTDQYGNAYLSDPTTGKSVKIYGMTATSTALVVENGEATFTNPKDAKTTLADVNNGDKIKVLAVYTAWAKNISCVLVSHTADSSKYKVNVATAENGTVTADKAEYSYGETVTLTVAPSAGYVVGTITATTAYGGDIDVSTVTENSKYTFKATVANNVVVTFKSEADTKCTVTLSPSTFKDKIPAKKDNVNKTDTEFTVNLGEDIGDVVMGGAYVYCNSNLMLYKNSNDANTPYFYNKTALPGSIVSITVETNTGASKTTYYKAEFGSAALSTYSSEGGVNIDQGASHEFVNEAVSDSKFFQISVTNGTKKSNGNIDKITIVYDTAK